MPIIEVQTYIFLIFYSEKHNSDFLQWTFNSIFCAYWSHLSRHQLDGGGNGWGKCLALNSTTLFVLLYLVALLFNLRMPSMMCFSLRILCWFCLSSWGHLFCVWICTFPDFLGANTQEQLQIEGSTRQKTASGRMAWRTFNFPWPFGEHVFLFHLLTVRTQLCAAKVCL